jgi:mRNA interferase RelE/StbE
MPDCYKIKLRAAGYRLVYQVEDKTVTVIVVAVGKRCYSANTGI